ncbi:hypothetical protein ACI75Y_02925 [Capnocytophaga stomatis]|uniref:hypothetical protein n=1 Tax=Capnocytophaga stomatis TaxID=1848904 RepID=UPI00385B7E67
MAIGSANKITIELDPSKVFPLENFIEKNPEATDKVLLANGETLSKSELKGDKGDTGERGQRGERGLQGEQGIQGADGKSAYQLWLDSGNQGSEQDFLNSLKGEGLSEEEKQQLIKKGNTDNILRENGTSITTTDLLSDVITTNDSIPQDIQVQVQENKIQFKQTSESQWNDLSIQPYIADFEIPKTLLTRINNGAIEYAFQGDNQWFPISLLSDLTGVDIAKKLLLRKLRSPFVFVEDYGANENSADNSNAIKKAIAVAASRKSVVFICGNYQCKSTIYVPSGLTIMGVGKHISGITNSTSNVTFCISNDVTFRDISIENKSRKRYAIHSKDVNAPYLHHCKINGMTYLYNETGKPLRGITVEHCDIICDFEGDYKGISDQKDVFSLYGYINSKFIYNFIQTRNVNRIFKFSIGNVTISRPYSVVSENNTRDIIIHGNIFKGSGGKQVVDMFNLSSSLRFINNHLELEDDGESNYNWSYLINYKSPNDLRDENDIGASIIFDGNNGVYPSDLLKLSGCFGVNNEGYNGTNYHSARITNNHIKRTRNNIPGGWMHIAFFNDVFFSGNTFEIKNLTGSTILQLSSNQNVVIDETNTFIGGNIVINKNTKNEENINFYGKGGNVLIKAQIKEFDARGAVILSEDFDYENITIDGMRSYPKISSTEYSLPIYCYNVFKATANIVVKNCDATKKGLRNVEPHYAQVLKGRIIEENNSWNKRFVSKTFNPSTIDAGASKSTVVDVKGVDIGDFVQATFNQYNAELELKAVVSEPNKVTVFFKNTGQNQIVLSSGEVKVRKL